MYLDPVAHADHHYAEREVSDRQWTIAEAKAAARTAEDRQTYVALLMGDEGSMADLLYQALSERSEAADLLCLTVGRLMAAAAHAAAMEADDSRRAYCAGYAKAQRILIETLAKAAAENEVADANPERFL